MMHKEIVTRRRTHVIFLTLIFLTVMLYMIEAVEMMEGVDESIKKILYVLIVMLLGVFFIKEIISCIVSYKYSIIADKFIINKIIGNKECNLASIRIKDIVYVGNRKGIPKKFKSKLLGDFSCYLFSCNGSYCIYRKDDKYYSIVFQPSENLMSKLQRCNSNRELLTEKVS